MNYQYLITHQELFPYAVGITHKQFELMLPKFSASLRLLEHQKAYEKKRLRVPGGGRKPAFKTDRQKLFFIFFYYKVYPTFRLAQLIFELDKSNCLYWKKFLEKVLFLALGYQLDLPKVKVKSLTGILEICPKLREFIIDATERPIQRPKDPFLQEKYYSGKRKRHTVKNQMIISAKTSRILAISGTVEGKLHDKRLMEEDGMIYRAPPKAYALGDSGYQGARKVHPWVRFITPLKKPPKGKLSVVQKQTNRAISQIRVKAEHVFSYLKHFAILSSTFRGRIVNSHQPFVNIACVYNFTRTYH